MEPALLEGQHVEVAAMVASALGKEEQAGE